MMSLPTSLRGKLVSAMLGLVVLVIGIISVSVVTTQRDMAEEQARRELLSLAHVVSDNTLAALLFSDQQSATQTLEALRIRPDLVAAALFDAQREPFGEFVGDASRHAPSMDLVDDVFRGGDPIVWRDASGLQVYIPMRSESELVGLVYLRDNLATLNASLERLYQLVITIGGLALVVGLAVVLWIQRLLNVPMGRFLATVQNITDQGDYSQRAPSSNTLEFQELAQRFNHMIAEIDLRGQQLEQINEELEQRVRERTEELESALEAAQEASRAKSEFVAVVSHEVRTPLNGIIGFAELLRLQERDPETRHTVEMLNDAGQSLLTLVNEILDFSKLDANKVELEMREFELASFVASVVDSHRAKAERKGIGIALAPIPTGHFAADTLRVRQVLSNLIDNAIKFTDRGGIAVSAELQPQASDTLVTLAITDTGIGIPADKIDAVFSPFTQADNSITRLHGGTGLGLSICRKLIELMNGRYGLESKPGHGSRFWFALPLTPVAEAEKPGIISAPEPAVSVAPGQRILVVEDNTINQQVAMRLLKALGHHCELAADGQEAIQKTLQTRYDLIFMDYHMPGMDGIEATHRILGAGAEALNAGVPIIALTADIQPQVGRAFRQAGARDLLVKPFTHARLKQMLQKWLGTEAEVTADGQASTDLALPAEPESAAATQSNAADQQELLVDSAVLDELCPLAEEGEYLVQELIGMFETRVPELLQQLDQAVAAEDRQQLFEAAHSLKSSAANLGAMRLSSLARQLEHCGREGVLEQAETQVAALKRCFEDTRLALGRRAENR